MKERLFYIDNLKNFALLLGPIFHVAIIYSKQLYVIHSKETNYFFEIIVHLIHSFRMPLFFFLSGFFSELVFEKYGVKGFYKNRIYRLVIPGLFGIVIISSVEGYFKYIQNYAIISFSDFYLLFFQKENFTFSHIWFIVFLILYSGFYPFLNRFNFSRFNWKYAYFFSFILLLLINQFYEKDSLFLLIPPFHFIFYISFFIVGIYIYKLKSIDSIPKNKILYFTIIPFFLIYLYLNENDPYWIKFEYNPFFRTLHIAVESILSWTILLLLLKIFKKYGNIQNRFLHYIKDSSMSIYLLHHPISILIGFLLLDSNLSLFFKFILQLLLVYIFSFSVYHFFVRPFSLVKFILGTK
jgi:glucan biosynthesis protein C